MGWGLGTPWTWGPWILGGEGDLVGCGDGDLLGLGPLDSGVFGVGGIIVLVTGPFPPESWKKVTFLTKEGWKNETVTFELLLRPDARYVRSSD